MGPSLPGPNINLQVLQFHNSVVMMTLSSINSNGGLNANITSLDSPTGAWILKAQAGVEFFYVPTLMIPDQLANCN